MSQPPMQQIRRPFQANSGGQGQNMPRTDGLRREGTARRVEASPQSVAPVKALLDEDDGHAGSIPSLLPLRLE